ncbi:8613_t:CDS:1, partial [Funneliformis caledonium]
MSREILLDETICKVLLSGLKLIFPERFSYKSSVIISKQIVALIETEIVSQSNIPSASKDLSLDESSLEE